MYENDVGGTEHWEAGRGHNFVIQTHSQEANLVLVHTVGEGAKNSTGNRREEPYTICTDVSFKYSHKFQIPNRTNGRALDQCSSAWHIRAAFSLLCSLSIMLLEAGCHTVDRVREDLVTITRVLKR
jgi:hypothetical protein